MAEKCASLQKIPMADIEMEKKQFGSGGFGKVFMARWNKEDVVVKIIKADSEEEEEAVKREANLAGSLSHPNVIKLFGITSVKTKRLGIVMEFAEHGSLDKWIGKIDHDKLTKIALGIVDGLEYVHSQKVIHRDIKPKNILMCGPEDDMIPKIADFGVAKLIERTTSHTSAGDTIYMAPEVSVYTRYSFPADIYSLAMTFFEMFNEQLIKQHQRKWGAS